MTGALVSWLREQIDEDERTARAAQAEVDEWRVGNFPERRWAVDREAPLGVYVRGEWCCVGEGPAALIGECSPERMLAEVDVKRRLLGEVERELADDVDNQTAVVMLRVLAIPYADRPGHRPEWALED